MLFPGNALASGPQAWFRAEKGLFKVKVGKCNFSIDPNGGFWYFVSAFVLPLNDQANNLT
jgi:hypothetical protein